MRFSLARHTVAISAVSVVLTLGVQPCAAGANLLVNGSFESGPRGPLTGTASIITYAGSTSIVGWVVRGTNINYYVGEAPAADSLCCLDLNGYYVPGGIAQSFATTPGTRYFVTFAMAGNPYGEPIKRMRVSASGQSADFSFNITGKSYGNMGWVNHTWDFVANSSLTTIEFNSLDPAPSPYGPLLDRVSVVQTEVVPPPSGPGPYIYVAQWGTCGSGNGQFNLPSGIAADGLGHLSVADYGNGRIQKFTSDGVYLTQWAVPGGWPNSIALDGHGNVYVTADGDNSVKKFTTNGTPATQWGGSGTGGGNFNYPAGIAVDGSGDIYVADSYNHLVQKFSGDGAFLLQWNVGPGSSMAPYGVAVDSARTVFVDDWGNSQVQKFSGTGTLLGQWGGSGSGKGQLNMPTGLAVDADGNIFVADYGNHRVQKFSSGGVLLAHWGSEGTGNGQFNYPHSVTVDGNGFVYVTDQYNCRIEKFVQPAAPTTFVIAASAGSNGSIAPTGLVSVPSGATQSFTITPGACQTVADVTVDGSSVGAVSSYSFANVTADHTISATFSPNNTFILAAHAGEGGTITPSGNVSVNCGADQSFAIFANPGFTIQDVLVDGSSVGAVSAYTFTNVVANHAIVASFAPPCAGANLLANGSFETGPRGPLTGTASIITYAGSTSIVGWVVTATNIDYYVGEAPAADSLCCLDLNGYYVPGGIAQSFATTPGTRYSVTFAMAGNPYGEPIKRMRVSASGQSADFSFNITGKSYSNMGWVNHTWDFVANSSLTTIAFSSLDPAPSPYGPLLDRVSVVQANATISASADANGLIVPSGIVPVSCDGTQTFTIIANPCYVLTDVRVDGTSVGAVNTYTFSDVQADHTIWATFGTYGPFSILATAGTGGTISPAGKSSVNCGDSLTYTITADGGLETDQVRVDGASVGADSTYTFYDNQANHTIEASFRELPTATTLATFIANPVVNGIEVRWQFHDPSQVSDVRLERANVISGPWIVVNAMPRNVGEASVAVDGDIAAGRIYVYRISALGTDGQRTGFGMVSGTASLVIRSFALNSVAPNPSFGSVRIEYSVPRWSELRLSVMDIQGRELAVLASGTQQPGVYQVTWSGRTDRGRVPAGLYFVRFVTPEGKFVGRITIAH